jgi:hypothetical protein
MCLSSSYILSGDTNLVGLKLCIFYERIGLFRLKCKFIGDVFSLSSNVRNSSALNL